MELTRLSGKDAQNVLMDNLFAIYSEALPASEQKPRDVLEGMLQNPYYYFYVLQDHYNTLGFAILYSPDDSDYCLLEYMAIDHTQRNRGLGGRIFDEIHTIFAKKHILIEIDSPHQHSTDTEIRKKRLMFYKSHGALYTEGLNYILPLESVDTPPDMLIMVLSATYRTSVPKQKLIEWLTDIYVSVYNCKNNDSRIGKMTASLPKNASLL